MIKLFSLELLIRVAGLGGFFNMKDGNVLRYLNEWSIDFRFWRVLQFVFVPSQDSDLVVRFCKNVESRSQKVVLTTMF